MSVNAHNPQTQSPATPPPNNPPRPPSHRPSCPNHHPSISPLISSLADDKKREIAFIDGAVAALSNAYPAHNVLIYHDDPGKGDSVLMMFDGVDTWVCDHVELDRTFGTKGYDVCLVRDGKVVRGSNQDEGERNWRWRTVEMGGGCLVRRVVKGLGFCEV